MSETQSEDNATSENDPLVGLELGNYKIVELIGEGGMGAVYAARHPVLGREVAVKVLSRKFCDEEDFLARFRQEALAANSVGHEVIVEATDFGSLPDGRSYYVMERLQGESLGVKMDREGSISLHETAELILPVMDALRAAHDSGVIHRDLKPDNIFLHRGRNDEIQPKLLDFGLAKMLEMDKTGTGVTTQTGLLLGTPLYMPPEQFSGKPETLGPWTDVYALAGVIYHMLAGRPPYDEHGFADLLMKHMQAPIPSICDRKAGMPQALDDALQLGLAKKPNERFQNMNAFRGAFEAAVRITSELGVGATIRPIPGADLFPRRRPGAHDIVTVAAHKPQAPTVASEDPAAADRASSGVPELTAARAISAELEVTRDSQAPVASQLSLPKAPDPEVTPPPADLTFDDERPGAAKPPDKKPVEQATVAARPKPEERVAAPAVSEPEPEPKRGSMGTVLLVLLLLGVAGGGGYAAWFYFQPPKEKPPSGTLMVDAQPKGALIRIDNEKKWVQSPVTRTLSVGSHRVTIKKSGFETMETWVSVRGGKQAKIALDLLPSSRPVPGPTEGPDGRPAPMGTTDGAMSPDPDPSGTAGMQAPPAMTGAPPDPRRRRRRGSAVPPYPRPRTAAMQTTMAAMGMSPRLSSLFTRPPNIAGAIRRVYSQIKGCFLKAKPGSAAIKARIRVSIQVGTSGKVTSARVSPGAVAATAVGRCIRGKVRRWKLPPYPNAYGYSFGVQFSSP